MLELFRLYQSETLTAPCDGVITGVDETGAYMLSTEGEWQLTLLANAPNGDDEASYTNFVGQVKEVGLDGLILRLNPQAFPVEDYKDLSGVNLDTALMTEEMIHVVTVPVYTLEAGEWVQIEAETLAAGDILLFAGDEEGNMVWIVKVNVTVTEPEVPVEPSEPTDPSQPETPEQPEAPEQSEDEVEPSVPAGEEQEDSSNSGGQQGAQGGSTGGMSGSFGAMGGSTQTETENSYYDLSTVTVASVIPQGEVTISITVDELDISLVKTGMEVEVTVNALTGEAFTGTVTEIASEGTNEGGNSKFTVTITLPRGENMLTGMNAAVHLTVAEKEAVLTIPVAAIVEEKVRSLVYTALDEDGNLANPVEVTTGISDGEYVEILSGLSEQDQIHYAYYDTLTESTVPDQGFQGFSFG